MTDAPFTVSDRACARIKAILAEQGAEQGAEREAPPALRVAVLAGGCSGFQYKFDLDHARHPDDLALERNGATVLVDPASLDLLRGAELDYKEALMGAHFAISNPNATAGCGCGASFSVD